MGYAHYPSNWLERVSYRCPMLAKRISIILNDALSFYQDNGITIVRYQGAAETMKECWNRKHEEDF
jgi:hypothetical protein